MTQLMNDERREGAGEGTEFRIGSWERPDPAGIVRRGGAATRVRNTAEKFGEGSHVCFVGSKPGVACDRPAVMEVYGIPMCEAHGEEAAAGALEEIAYDLEQEIQRPMNPEIRSLSPHLEHALGFGIRALTGYADTPDYRRADAALLAAFPLDRSRVTSETLSYIEDPDGGPGAEYEHPLDTFMSARMLLHRHMRLAFEAEADWLVEVLERKREDLATQVAYAVALEIEAGFRPAPERGE